MAGLTMVLAIGAWSPFAGAADSGGDCCADLEERVAELEATTTRKGNRKVSVTLSGHIHEAVMWWDDGGEQDAYVVNVKNDQSIFGLSGEAAITPGLSAGFQMSIQIAGSLSDEVNQAGDDGDASGGGGDSNVVAWNHLWWLKSEQLGQLTVGLTGNNLDGAPEVDLSETNMAAYSGVADIGGGFFIRRSGIAGGVAGRTPVTWADLIDHYNPDTTNIVRYDSPKFAGFAICASWGEDDEWQTALTYAGEFELLKIEGAIAYREDTDDPAPGTDNKTLAGSLSALHRPTGLNLTLAAGRRDFVDQFLANDGVLRTQESSHYYYIKAGLIQKLTPLGNTAFFADYGKFSNIFGAIADADAVNALDLDSNNTVCAAAGQGCLVGGSKATIWGAGVVQQIDAAAMQIYLTYRHYEAEVDLVDVGGNRIRSGPLDSFQTVLAGARIEF